MDSGPGDAVEQSFGRLRWATHSSTYVLEVVAALAKGIAVSSRHIKAIDRHVDGWCYELEHEREVQGTLLGATFVVWQTYLSTMVSAVLEVDEQCRSALGIQLSILEGGGRRRRKVLAFGGPIIAGTTYTVAEIIEAFANYFKHRDEWTADWTGLKDNAEETAQVIRSCGAVPDGANNFQTGAEALGVREPYDDFRVVDEMLSKWVGHIEMRARSDILAVAPQYKRI
jgi:hypothetical protein